LAEVEQKIRELIGNPTIEIKQITAPIKSPPSPLLQMGPQIRHRRAFEALKKLLLRESLNQPPHPHL
jgi:hypothetical protein